MTLAQIGFVDGISSFRPVSWTLTHDYFVERWVKFFIILLIKQPNRRRVRKFRSGVKPANRRAAWRKPMAPPLVASGVCAAIAGAAMVVAVSSSPSFAFTLSSPCVTDQVIKADVHQIYYYRRRYYYHHYYHRYYRSLYHHYYHQYYHRYYHHYYHPYYYHRYYYHRYYYPPYYHPYYHPYYYHPYYYRNYYYQLY